MAADPKQGFDAGYAQAIKDVGEGFGITAEGSLLDLARRACEERDVFKHAAREALSPQEAEAVLEMASAALRHRNVPTVSATVIARLRAIAAGEGESDE